MASRSGKGLSDCGWQPKKPGTDRVHRKSGIFWWNLANCFRQFLWALCEHAHKMLTKFCEHFVNVKFTCHETASLLLRLLRHTSHNQRKRTKWLDLPTMKSNCSTMELGGLASVGQIGFEWRLKYGGSSAYLGKVRWQSMHFPTIARMQWMGLMRSTHSQH